MQTAGTLIHGWKVKILVKHYPGEGANDRNFRVMRLSSPQPAFSQHRNMRDNPVFVTKRSTAFTSTPPNIGGPMLQGQPFLPMMKQTSMPTRTLTPFQQRTAHRLSRWPYMAKTTRIPSALHLTRGQAFT